MASFLANSSSDGLQVVPATLGLLLFSVVGFLSLNLGNQTITLTWLPLLIISLWPRRILPSLTIVLFLVFGLFIDWGSVGAPGQWALVYLTCLLVLRPDKRVNPINFSGAIKNWFIAAITAAIVISVTGWIVYGRLPDAYVLAQQAGLVTLFMPIFYLLRFMVRYVLTDPDERGY